MTRIIRITSAIERDRLASRRNLRTFADAGGAKQMLLFPSATRLVVAELIRSHSLRGVRIPRSLRMFLRKPQVWELNEQQAARLGQVLKDANDT